MISAFLSSRNVHIEDLKNALLSHALYKVCKEDMIGQGQGTLPIWPSKCSDFETECMMYVLDKNDRKACVKRKRIWYDVMMERQGEQIDRYIESKFQSEEDVYKFLSQFLSSCNTPSNQTN